MTDNDYFVEMVKTGGRYVQIWKWRISRNSSPMGVLLEGSDPNEARARAAGNNALLQLLRGVRRDGADLKKKRPSTRPYVPEGSKHSEARSPVFPSRKNAAPL